jgi:hypothetical protein
MEYQDPMYEKVLNTWGTFLDDYRSDTENGIKASSETWCRRLGEEYRVPPPPLEGADEKFRIYSGVIAGANPAKVIATVGRFMVPSAELLAAEKGYTVPPTESYGEDWTHSMPLTGRAPRPDYSVSTSSIKSVRITNSSRWDLDATRSRRLGSTSLRLGSTGALVGAGRFSWRRRPCTSRL